MTHAVNVPGSPEKFHLYLLVGQSNMAGRGLVEEADTRPIDRVLVLDQGNQWSWQGEPIHFDKPVAGVGLGFTFGRLMAEAQPEINVGLIPCAVGGTFIEEWKPGVHLFEEAVKRSRIAMRDGTLMGILWHQGEGASGDALRTEAYLRDLTEVIEGFREAFASPDLPFVAGELGEFLYTRPKNPCSHRFNEQLNTLSDLVPRTAVASSKGLVDKGDQLHFDAASLKTFGKRYFAAFTTLVKGRVTLG